MSFLETLSRGRHSEDRWEWRMNHSFEDPLVGGWQVSYIGDQGLNAGEPKRTMDDTLGY